MKHLRSSIVFAVLLFVFSVVVLHGAHLSDPQKVTLKADVVGNQTTNTLYVNGDLQGLADHYNAQASPTFTVWKTNVPIAQVGDNFVGADLSGLTTANQTRLQTIAAYSQNGINPSLADRRAFFDDVFSGAGGTATRAKLLLLWKRTATRLEKLFASGTGSDASPATMAIGVEGLIDYTEFQGL